MRSWFRSRSRSTAASKAGSSAADNGSPYGLSEVSDEKALMRPESQRGFTLIELLVVLVVIGQIFVLIVMLFDFSTKLSHVQTNVAEMQQSLRVAQYDTVRLIRMAGRGGLPVGIVPASPSVFQGVAVAVSDNVPNNT